MNEQCDLLWRLALSEATLDRGYLFLRHLPPPTNSVYKIFSGVSSQSDGGAVQHGYIQATLTWSILTPAQANRILRYVDVSLAGSGLLYATISKNNATGVGKHFIDIRGIAHPMDIEEEGMIVGSDLGMAYQNVRLFINNITVINDPAIF